MPPVSLTHGSAELLRLHASENSHGASPAAVAAAAGELTRLHRYPDGPGADLVAALAEFHGVPRERVSIGNGVDEVILLLVLAEADEARPSVVTGATFTSYRNSLLAARRPFTTVPLREHRTPVPEIAAALRGGAPLAFVCTPHNPTGGLLTAAEIAELRAAAVAGGGVLVVDEAYGEFAGPGFASALGHAATGGNVCVLKTFSKAYGLAGLRVGYLVGDPAVVARVNRLHSALPYHVNRVAQGAAVAALADQGFVLDSVARTVSTREAFRRALRGAGLRALPSAGNFVLVPLGPAASAAAVELRERGFAVRDTADMGLPHHIRVSIGLPDEMRSLLDELAALPALRPAVHIGHHS